ncbi:MAG: hypothetical protein HY016_10560 [Nitrosomonadales bacterium]|nr:hypothetical protein [Nitrosomonadales bacterium]
MKAILFTVSLATALSGLLVGHTAYAADEQFSLSTGFDYSSGNYGTPSSSDVPPVPVTGKYELGRSVFKLSAPTSAQFFASGEGMANHAATTPSTFGDAVAAATYNIYENTASNFKVDLTGKARLAAANTAIGVRTHDYAAQANIYQGFDKFTAMGSLGSKVIGHTGGLTLNTVLYGSFGGAYQFAKQTSGGVNVSSIQDSSAAWMGPQEVTAYVDYKIDKGLKVQGYLLKGLSNENPVHGVGAFLSSKF